MVERGTALLRKMEISVAEAEKRTGKNTVNMQETYTVYLIEIRYVCQQRIWFPHLYLCFVLFLKNIASKCFKPVLSFCMDSKGRVYCLVTFTASLEMFENILHFYLPVGRPAESVPEGATPAAPDTLWRRYSEFELLRTYLLVTYPYIIIPPLPEKRVSVIYLEI